MRRKTMPAAAAGDHRCVGIEDAMNQAANTVGLRKARCRGLKKVELEHYIAATAINLIRLDPHLADQPIERGHTGRLLRLHTTLND
jgi:hypothetical protein